MGALIGPIAEGLGWLATGLGLGWGAAKMGSGVGSASEQTGQGIADSLRIAVPIVAVGAALYLWHKGAK